VAQQQLRPPIFSQQTDAFRSHSADRTSDDRDAGRRSTLSHIDFPVIAVTSTVAEERRNLKRLEPAARSFNEISDRNAKLRRSRRGPERPLRVVNRCRSWAEILSALAPIVLVISAT
jgi:hypothetical protein